MHAKKTDSQGAGYIGFDLFFVYFMRIIFLVLLYLPACIL